MASSETAELFAKNRFLVLRSRHHGGRRFSIGTGMRETTMMSKKPASCENNGKHPSCEARNYENLWYSIGAIYARYVDRMWWISILLENNGE